MTTTNLAHVERQDLTDLSQVWNVVIPETEYSARIVIGAESHDAAIRMCDSINANAVYATA